MTTFINSYKILPKELFRINNGLLVRLRPWDSLRKPRRFDIYLTDEGIALPKALDRASYKGKQTNLAWDLPLIIQQLRTARL